MLLAEPSMARGLLDNMKPSGWLGAAKTAESVYKDYEGFFLAYMKWGQLSRNYLSTRLGHLELRLATSGVPLAYITSYRELKGRRAKIVQLALYLKPILEQNEGRHKSIVFNPHRAKEERVHTRLRLIKSRDHPAVYMALFKGSPT